MQVKMFINEQPDIPYRALNYLVADVNYGGRVTDPKDKLLIASMLQKYFCADIMNDNYKLSKLDGYYAPPEGSLDDVKAYVNSLPLDDEPEIFGLHSNANIVYEQNMVNAFIDTVL
jgi:dynein heavy chain